MFDSDVSYGGSYVIPGDCDVITFCCHAELCDETLDESSVKLGSVRRSADATQRLTCDVIIVNVSVMSGRPWDGFTI